MAARRNAFLALIAIAIVSPPVYAACPNFAAAVNYAAGTAPRGVAVGDFNRDGKLDLAVANSNSFSVSILLGNGTAPSPRR
ncbi:MAG TPA: VCBS repeat-containing protein [Thermoanaerobaculia bacterium]|nr:VCBS repeat-containing protein [Thermoanaerobaculia bacterium]